MPWRKAVRPANRSPRASGHVGTFERHVDVFEDSTGCNAAEALIGFHQVIARFAMVLASQGIYETKRFSELTGTHQKTCAVGSPRSFLIHYFSPPLGGGLFESPDTNSELRLLVFSCSLPVDHCGFAHKNCHSGFQSRFLLVREVRRMYPAAESGSIHKNCATTKFLCVSSPRMERMKEKLKLPSRGQNRSGVQVWRREFQLDSATLVNRNLHSGCTG